MHYKFQNSKLQVIPPSGVYRQETGPIIDSRYVISAPLVFKYLELLEAMKATKYASQSSSSPPSYVLLQSTLEVLDLLGDRLEYLEIWTKSDRMLFSRRLVKLFADDNNNNDLMFSYILDASLIPHATLPNPPMTLVADTNEAEFITNSTPLTSNFINSAYVNFPEVHPHFQMLHEKCNTAHALHKTLLRLSNLKINSSTKFPPPFMSPSDDDPLQPPSPSSQFTPYLPPEYCASHPSVYYRTTLVVTDANYNEAICTLDSGGGKIAYVNNRRRHFNRAIHGDEVYVQLFREDDWECPVGRRRLQKENDNNDNEPNNDLTVKGPKLPTGKVVSLVPSPPREPIICTKINNLFVPMNMKMPMVWLSGGGGVELEANRLLVQITSWDIGARFPEGRFVKSIGRVGDLETEIQVGGGRGGGVKNECVPFFSSTINSRSSPLLSVSFDHKRSFHNLLFFWLHRSSSLRHPHLRT